MNKNRFKGALALAFALVFVLASTVTTFAIDSGDTISFTGSEGTSTTRPATFTTSADPELVGTCAQGGAPVGASGSAEVTELSNNGKLAKVVWYYGINKQWWGDTSQSGGFYFSNWHALHYMIQAQRQGYSNWKSIMTSGGYLSEGSCNMIIDKLESTDFDSINVPDDFELYLCEPADSSKQTFVLWKMNTLKKGILRLKKASANPAITG